MSGAARQSAEQERRTPPSLLYVTTVASTAVGFLSPFARALTATGWRVELATNVGNEEPSSLAAFEAVHDVPMSRSLRDARGLARASRAMVDVVASGFDIVHVHTPIAAFITRLAIARLPGRSRPAVAYTAHGFHFHHAGHPATNALFVMAERLAGRWTDRLVVINEEDFAAARRHRLVPRHRLVHMPGIGLDTTHFSRAAVGPDATAGIRQALSIPATVPVFAFVGDMNRNKRTADVVAALGRMQNPDARVVFVGDGPECDATRALAGRLGVAERVRVTGFVGDVRPYVAASTALILPSVREGLARSIMEALSLEVPVIASTARGNAEVVDGDGFIFETGDVQRLAECMDWLIDHPTEGSEMGRRGRRRMVDRYELRRIIPLHEKMYRDMLIR